MFSVLSLLLETLFYNNMGNFIWYIDKDLTLLWSLKKCKIEGKIYVLPGFPSDIYIIFAYLALFFRFLTCIGRREKRD